MGTIDLLLVDDHPLFRDGFAGMSRVLRPNWTLRFAGCADEARDRLAGSTPALAVIDIALPGSDGFTLAESFAARGIACVLISGREDAAARARARLCGARGFIAKAAPPDAIVGAIDTVLAGGTAFDADPVPAIDRAQLTARQTEVLALLAEGHGNKEIRHRLGIAERTVRAHLTDLFHLLGAQSRTQAIIRAREIGLIG